MDPLQLPVIRFHLLLQFSENNLSTCVLNTLAKYQSIKLNKLLSIRSVLNCRANCLSQHAL